MTFATLLGWGKSGSVRCLMLGIGWGTALEVLYIPFTGHFMWPFAVAVLGGRYLVVRVLVRFGQPSRNPACVALSSVDIGGLHID